MVKAVIPLEKLVPISQFTFNYEVTRLCSVAVDVCHSACVVPTITDHRELNFEYLLAT